MKICYKFFFSSNYRLLSCVLSNDPLYLKELFFFSQDGKLPSIQETRLTYFDSPVGEGKQKSQMWEKRIVCPIGCLYFTISFFFLPKALINGFKVLLKVVEGLGTIKYRLFGNEREFINGCCRTISGHFFANCINIFHKTEVQTVILVCLMGQNLNWFKIYNAKCTRRPGEILAESEIDHQIWIW